MFRRVRARCVRDHTSAIDSSRSATRIHRARERRANALLTRKILPLERVRLRCVPAAHALDRRLEIPKTFLLNRRTQLRAEPTEARGLVHDDAAASPLHRIADRIDVERN